MRKVNVSLQRKVYFIMVWLYENIKYFFFESFTQRTSWIDLSQVHKSTFQVSDPAHYVTRCIKINLRARCKLLIRMLISHFKNSKEYFILQNDESDNSESRNSFLNSKSKKKISDFSTYSQKLYLIFAVCRGILYYINIILNPHSLSLSYIFQINFIYINNINSLKPFLILYNLYILLEKRQKKWLHTRKITELIFDFSKFLES